MITERIDIDTLHHFAKVGLELQLDRCAREAGNYA